MHAAMPAPKSIRRLRACTALAVGVVLLALSFDSPATASDESAAAAGDGLAVQKVSVRIARIRVKEGVSFDDAVESLRLRANQRNLKFVGINHLGKEIETLGGKPWRSVEIFSFCDALAAQKMLEADSSMLAYMPCRIGIEEDGQGGVWVIAMLLDEAVIDALPPVARASARHVTATIREVMVAAARGEL